MHYYKFNIADWQSSTRHLTPEEEGVYFRLINHYYDTEKPIPLETESVIRRLMLGNCKDVVMQILDEFFVKTDKGYEKEKCNELIKEYRKNSKKNKENGAKGGRPRKGAALKETQSVSSGNPEVTQEEPKHNPNYKPLTINHKPLTNEKDMCPQAVTPDQKFNDEIIPKPKKPQKRFIKPTPSDVASYCEERNNFVDAEKFFNHYESNGWRVGKNPMKDWKAAVRTWEKNSFQNNTGNSNAKNIGSNNTTGEFDFLDEDTGWMQEIYDKRGMQFEQNTGGRTDVQREFEGVARAKAGLEDLGNQKP